MLNTHGTLANLIDSILGIFNVILPVLAAAALALFMYGAFQYVYSAGNEKNRSAMLWSLIALFVIFSVWGILRILKNTLAV